MVAVNRIDLLDMLSLKNVGTVLRAHDCDWRKLTLYLGSLLQGNTVSPHGLFMDKS